ncbi:MAG: NAD-dependent epimerase/dehydratase family protein [Alphaproteobacteria bacterium]|nr:NAD-dependent epimerase/dehydratase family protein [Alphaproteobacteria bacterium]
MVENTVLVTGAAGFIGFHLARQLLAEGRVVVGLDNLNSCYDPALKRARLALLTGMRGFSFAEIDLADGDAMKALFARHRFPTVVHLAAPAGVRYSIENPQTYVSSNLVGFLNILEGARFHGCRHLVYASSSSVYGANTKMPFAVLDRTDHPVSFYAATKKANEVMAQAYSHLYRLPVTGLRFFTIYGPWGRPDMALFLFADAIVKGQPIRLFNEGRMRRDFTYIDDVVAVLATLTDRIPTDNPAAGNAPSVLYNVGNHRPEELMRLVGLLEQELGRSAGREMLPMQPGDVPETFADISDLMADTGFAPTPPIDQGVRSFVHWYRGYFEV